MRTIICNFKSNGENVKVTAVINDALTELSKSKKNQATNIIDDFILEDEEWGIFFEVSDNIGYEVQFKTNDGQKTLKPVKAITWEGGADAVITDVQKVKITVK